MCIVLLFPMMFSNVYVPYKRLHLPVSDILLAPCYLRLNIQFCFARLYIAVLLNSLYNIDMYRSTVGNDIAEDSRDRFKVGKS